MAKPTTAPETTRPAPPSGALQASETAAGISTSLGASANTSAPRPAPLEPEHRHRMPIWVFLLGFLALIGGAYLLYIEDASQVRATIQQRSEAPARPGLALPGFASNRAATPRGFDTRTQPTASVAYDGTARAFPPSLLDDFWRDAEPAGIRRATFDRAFAAAATFDPDVVTLAASQPEFDRTVGDYVSSIVNPDRVATGRARLEQNAAILGDIERRFGVDRHILLAIWGIESNFGVAKGDRSVIRSLATLAVAEPRRSAFWKSELIAALTILEQERLAPERLVGSWAGAMGHTQFMPSTFLKHAVDFDGDGVRDLWSSVPDALASTARYLQASGWASNRTWGREVVLPTGFDYSLASPTTARPVSGWRVLGVRAVAGSLPPDDTSAWQLVVPAGASGPAFLVSPNFDALLAYNRAYSYAVAVGTLADRIAGYGPIQTSWPAGDLPMTRDQRIEIQEILQSLGFDVGGIDGIIGTKTREAIRSFQKARSMPADGHPSLALLNRIRTERRL